MNHEEQERERLENINRECYKQLREYADIRTRKQKLKETNRRGWVSQLVFVLTAVIFGCLLSTLLSPQIRRITNPILHPGYSACGRCNRTWDVADGHVTDYDNLTYGVASYTHATPIESIWITNYWYYSMTTNAWEVFTVTNGLGCFPLCKECWLKLGSPEKRLPYYRSYAKQWLDGDAWKKLEQSVMDGK